MCTARQQRHSGFLGIIVVISIVIGFQASHARKELLSPEEKDQLQHIERLQLDGLVLTPKGAEDPASLTTTATARLAQLGYHMVSDAGQPADAIVKIKCEERKTWEGTGRSGGDADMVDAAARLWKGPACQISYRIGARPSDWRHEIRTPFADPQEAAKKAGKTDAGAYAIAALIEQVRTDSFPFLLAAEWGHQSRLVAALNGTGVTTPQKVTIIGLIGATQSAETIPTLTAALKDSDPAVAEAASLALGTIGHEDGIAPLLALFASTKPEQRRIAVPGLGRLAPLYPSSAIVPTLLTALPTEPVPNQTLIVRALGKTTDRRILGPLRTLHRSVLQRSPEQMTPELKELRSTLGIALDQFDGTHTEE